MLLRGEAEVADVDEKSSAMKPKHSDNAIRKLRRYLQ